MVVDLLEDPCDDSLIADMSSNVKSESIPNESLDSLAKSLKFQFDSNPLEGSLLKDFIKKEKELKEELKYPRVPQLRTISSYCSRLYNS